MPHAPGTNLGGARTLDDVRGRCWIDPSTGCWHLRSKYGRPWDRGTQLKVWWVPSHSTVMARPLTWSLHHGRPVRSGMCISDSCGTWDCINPEHLRELTRKQSARKHAERGAFRSAAALAARRDTGASRSKLTPELVQWAIESQQSAVAVATALGISHSAISARRARARQRHIFGGSIA